MEGSGSKLDLKVKGWLRAELGKTRRRFPGMVMRSKMEEQKQR
jgi:hypothetical protein